MVRYHRTSSVAYPLLVHAAEMGGTVFQMAFAETMAPPHTPKRHVQIPHTIPKTA